MLELYSPTAYNEGAVFLANYTTRDRATPGSKHLNKEEKAVDRSARSGLVLFAIETVAGVLLVIR